MAGPSAEALLVSALLNTASVGEEALYQVSSTDFIGYPNEYTWLTTFVVEYGCQPSIDIFRARFPDFPFSPHADVRSAANMLHRDSNRRRLTEAIGDAAELIALGDAGAAYDTVIAAEPRRATARPRNLLTDTAHLDEWTAKPYRIELPYPTLQRATGGIRAGNLWYLAGRPGQGKSAQVGNIAKHAVLGGNRVLFYSLEMSEEEVRARFHAAMASELNYPQLTMTALLDRHVDLSQYRKFHGELGEKLTACGGVLDVHTPALGPVSPSVVKARAGDYDLVVIDYVGLMASDDGGHAIDDWRVLARISNALKEIPLAQHTRMLCASQINREGDSGHAPPKVKNLAQSDALGQDGDVVLTMRSKPHDVATHFSLEKNRHGPSGIYFYTTFDPNRGTYIEVSSEHVEDLVINAEVLADSSSPPPALRIIRGKDTL